MHSHDRDGGALSPLRQAFTNNQKTMSVAVGPSVSSGDRLSFTLFLAAIFHAVLIFGIGFTAPEWRGGHVMEVTLALHRSDKANPQADFLAQANQEGSGELSQAEILTSPHQSDYHDQVIRETRLQEESAPQQAVDEQQRRILATRGRSDRSVALERSADRQEEKQQVKDSKVAMQAMTSEIASLEARLAARQQAYAKRPRVRSVSSVSTRYDRDAAYIDAFRSKIEMIGNQHYPEAARQQHLTGEVRLLVAIMADGRVKDIQILKRSGHRVLDEAAERSVRMAEPFQRFPAAIAADTDVLQIIRTWKFAETLSSEAD